MCFAKWFNSNAFENPEVGMQHFFRECRPTEDIPFMMGKMW